jgi:hypothetical protein
MTTWEGSTVCPNKKKAEVCTCTCKDRVKEMYEKMNVDFLLDIYVVYMLLFCTSYNLYKIFIQVITCITLSYKL